MEWCIIKTLVKEGIEFLKNPYQTIKRIIETDVRSNGEEYQFDKTEKEMESLIWEVQLKTVFPLRIRAGILGYLYPRWKPTFVAYNIYYTYHI